MTVRYYWVRFILGLLALSLALACSAILDTGGLNTEPAPDGSGHDGTTDQEIIHDILPGDLGSCQSGKACTVVGQKGPCAVGKSECYDSGTGTCVQTVQPAKETCNGQDQDCDGTADQSDPQAHSSCGAGKYCNKTACANGCYTNSQCTGSTNTCAEHVCKCGTAAACKQPNPVCSAGKCVCDSNSTCKDNETCASGVCNCGSTAGPAEGPACTTGTCNPATGQCVVPSDIGPDVGPPDTGPDLPQPDLPPVDLPPTPDLPPADLTAADSNT